MLDNKEQLRKKFLQTGELLIGGYTDSSAIKKQVIKDNSPKPSTKSNNIKKTPTKNSNVKNKSNNKPSFITSIFKYILNILGSIMSVIVGLAFWVIIIYILFKSF